MSSLVQRATTEQPRLTPDSALDSNMMLSSIKRLLGSLPANDGYRRHATEHVDVERQRIIAIDPDCEWCQIYLVKKKGA